LVAVLLPAAPAPPAVVLAPVPDADPVVDPALDPIVVEDE